MKESLRFREVQHFRQPWLWLFFGVAIALLIILEREWIGAAGLAALALFFGMASMETRVDDQGVSVRSLYFIRRRFDTGTIRSAEAITYRPLRDYGGWGLRYGGRKGWALNVSGNRGVVLHLSTGKDFMIGSQRPDDLAAAIARTL